HEALGRPERWRYPVGHVGLFLVLPGASEEICDWLDAWSPPHAPETRGVNSVAEPPTAFLEENPKNEPNTSALPY
ncbi:MAG: hypothetical protein MK085_08610, partial [Phycisphaerales bacterium]|nr:hypothetical protein [Phycisphaerales bacterium]